MNAEDLIKDVVTERFEPNSFYELLLELRSTNPKAFAAISPASKLSLLHYEALKRKAEMLKEKDGLTHG